MYCRAGPTRVKSGPRMNRKNANKMLLGGLIILSAKAGRPAGFPMRAGAPQIPSVNAPRSREKGGMPSRPNACSSDTATATIAFAANLQF